jgi:hypothetical protein
MHIFSPEAGKDDKKQVWSLPALSGFGLTGKAAFVNLWA